ncbi:hypothetical protein [Mesomycoplasma ovipneumoniae]|nr:hypothetical protein [Mesomycoplasma ovipneumoniae]
MFTVIFAYLYSIKSEFLLQTKNQEFAKSVQIVDIIYKDAMKNL